jgi:hypothetical protein
MDYDAEANYVFLNGLEKEKAAMSFFSKCVALEWSGVGGSCYTG